ncbi:Tetratricopeptide repeat protein 28 [Stylophora pistillata]|uniref:Tetratricopeptide repeat protein 28 n=1 Tax=Stylophora pistillata TaxID=50429 RepID=A0A2B4REG4_STYPI|nr:Tetratricopeptide repeat protein 28 [Stylophora pistillata]
MIGELLGITPLVGEHATKQAVLQAINSVSLIYFAAHGSDERGEMFLSPESANRCVPPREESYLFTMREISQIQMQAKLVVLGCCHSAHGEIKTEGVIGIAREFLGSGARSVLAARWMGDPPWTTRFDSAQEEMWIERTYKVRNFWKMFAMSNFNFLEQLCHGDEDYYIGMKRRRLRYVKNTKIFIFCALLALAASAFGRPVVTSDEREIDNYEDGTFETMDTDGDGGITPDELAQGLDISLLIANRYVVAFDAKRDGELDSKAMIKNILSKFEQMYCQ